MPSRTQSILIAGVATGVLGLAISLMFGSAGVGGAAGVIAGCITCILYTASGVVAAWHYTNTHGLTIPGGTGAGMGALAGLLSAFIASASGIAALLTGRTAAMQEEMLRQMEDSGMDAAQAEQMVELFSSPAAMIGSVFIALAVAAILGAIGGAVGASMFKRGGDGAERSADSF